MTGWGPLKQPGPASQAFQAGRGTGKDNARTRNAMAARRASRCVTGALALF